MLALISGIGELIPIVGPVLAAIPAVAVAGTVSLKKVLLVVIFFVVQQQFENHVLVPKVMSRQVGVSAVTVITALLIGGKLLGIPAPSSPYRPPPSCRCSSPNGWVARNDVGRALAGSRFGGSRVRNPCEISSSLQDVCPSLMRLFEPRTRNYEPRPERYTRPMRQDPLAYLGRRARDAASSRASIAALRVLDDEQKAHTTFDHRSVVNLSSNNYLGLTTHPRLRERALEAIEQFGVGSGSVRTIAGTMAIHMELERRLAEFKHDRSRRRLSERLRRQRRHGVGDPHARTTSSSPTSSITPASSTAAA